MPEIKINLANELGAGIRIQMHIHSILDVKVRRNDGILVEGVLSLAIIH